MIAPSLDTDALATRLDRLPSRLREALTRELDRLGQSLRDRFGSTTRLALTIDTGPNTITATLASSNLRPPSARALILRTAGVPPAPSLRLRPRRPASRAMPRRISLSSALDAMAPEIRARLATAAREALLAW
jgi:hypothetical protein